MQFQEGEEGKETAKAGKGRKAHLVSRHRQSSLADIASRVRPGAAKATSAPAHQARVRREEEGESRRRKRRIAFHFLSPSPQAAYWIATSMIFVTPCQESK
jgi:hypothetical protein